MTTYTPAAEDIESSGSNIDFRRIVNRGLIYGGLIFLALLFLIPVYMAVVTSLKDPEDTTLETAWSLPSDPDLEKFEEAFDQLSTNLGNSFILVIFATAGAAILGSLNGYVLSKWHVPGEKILFPLILFGMFLPYQAILIPLFEFMRSINLYGGLPGLILIHIVYGLPITTLIFRNFYVEIPDEMLEAAAIDGAGFWRLYTQIVFPLSLPGFVVVIIWQFTQIWNDFLFGVSFSQAGTQPVTVALNNIVNSTTGVKEYNVDMAAAIIAALPTLFVYVVAGKYFIRGLTAGSVKG